MTDDTNSKLWHAMLAVQGKLRDPKKDAENPHFRSRYLNLYDLVSYLRPLLTEQKLVLLQRVDATERGNILTTLLQHVDGGCVSTSMLIVPEKQTPQAVGSALTYARRQTLAALFCISGADDDDDANEASAPPNAAAKPHPQGKKPFEGVEEAVSAFAQCVDGRQLNIAIQRVQATMESKYPLSQEDRKLALQACQEAKDRLADGGRS